MHTRFISGPALSPFRAALQAAAAADQAPAVLPPRKKRSMRAPHVESTVQTVRGLIENSTLTYGEIARRTGTSPASISRWMQTGEWKRPPFAPRSMSSVPTPRASVRLKHRTLAVRLTKLTDRYVRELEDAPAIDLEKLAAALELLRMAKLAVMRRTPRRAYAETMGHLMRPIDELCAVGVDLHRAPKEAVDDFLENRRNRDEVRKEDLPARSRGRGTPRYRTQAQRHARLMEEE
jgi:hypothetical protein